MQNAGARLMALPQLGRDVFARGAPEDVSVVHTSVFTVTLYDLLSAYARQADRGKAGPLRISPTDLYSMDEALKRLGDMLGHVPDWRAMTSFLPPEFRGGLRGRSALAAMLAASLELVRAGRAQLRQDGAFGPIYLRANVESR
jgi:segregation and condensation protein A